MVGRRFWVSETWVRLLLAVIQAFLACLFSDMPLACLGWPLTIAALSRASSAIFWNLGNSFKGFQHMASKRQFKLM